MVKTPIIILPTGIDNIAKGVPCQVRGVYDLTENTK